MAINLLTTNSRVESPFIIVTLGGYTFGNYTKTTQNVLDENGFTKKVMASFPNYVTSLSVDKINGTVNTYTLNITYAIQAGDDPNKIDKILSRASRDRKIKISYGDYSTPHYIYREEEALITKVTSNINVKSSTVVYTILATSSAAALNAGNYIFAKRTAKPSDVIQELLFDERYGLMDIFYGMRDKDLIKTKGLIATDDKKVTIEAKNNVTILDYFSYLVNCMVSVDDALTALNKKHKYIFSVYDDISGELGGPYFKIQRVAHNVQEANSLNTYEIDIGYPSANIVTAFDVTDNQAYSILYDYSQKIQQSNYGYRLNDRGEFDYIYAPTLTNSSELYRTTVADRTWWSQVTQYPISATLTLKGLLRPAVLMTYIKLNVLFFGQKHISSGTYIITKQTDNVSTAGFRTTLNLVRIKGDELN